MKLDIHEYGHFYNRGHRKHDIVRDSRDKWHFLQALYYLNNQKGIMNPFRELRELLKSDFNSQLVWPEILGERLPLVKILSFKLRKNHFHLQLKPEVEDGASIFMQRIGIAMAKHFNQRYQEVGSLFQGRYKVKKVETDDYMMYLSVYIQIKNAFEEYPGGLKVALKEFDKAYAWASRDPYNSLGDYAGNRNSPIIDKDILGRMFSTTEKYKAFTMQCMLRENIDERLGKLCID